MLSYEAMKTASLSRLALALLLLVTLGLSSRCTSPSTSGSDQAVPTAAAPSRPVGLIFSASRQGEIDPCGCALHQNGGLERMANLVLKKRLEGGPLLVVDAGDTFFAAPQLNPRREAEGLNKAKVIAQSYKVMELSALVPGERDFALGLDRLRELEALSGATLVAANLKGADGQLLFKERTLVIKEGMKIGIFGIVSEEAFAAIPQVKVEDWKAAAQAQTRHLKAEGANYIIALSHLGLNTDRELAELGDIDVVVGSHSQDVTSVPVRGKGGVIVQPHPQGHQVGYLKLLPSKRVEDFALVDLDRAYDGKNQVSEFLDEVKREQAKAAHAGLSVHYQASAERPYVAHPYTCRSCHRAQYDFWEKTKHASAYLVLFSKSQHFNPECIGCHSLGFEQPGGFEKIGAPITLNQPVDSDYMDSLMGKVFADEASKGPLDSRLQPERHRKLHRRYQDVVRGLEAKGQVVKWYIGVQCEHCHGNRQGHPEPSVATQKKVDLNACRECHRPPNAPQFDPALIKRVACPLMKPRPRRPGKAE